MSQRLRRNYVIISVLAHKAYGNFVARKTRFAQCNIGIKCVLLTLTVYIVNN